MMRYKTEIQHRSQSQCVLDEIKDNENNWRAHQTNGGRQVAEGGFLITALQVEETQADHVVDICEPGKIQKV